MKKLLIGTVIASAAIVVPATLAGATDGSLSFGQNCSGVTVTVQSKWDGGSLDIHIDAPVNGGGEVGPLQTVTFPFGWNGMNKMHVVVWTTNGHLNGQPPMTRFSHDFVLSEDCGSNTTTTPPPTTPPTTTCDQASPPQDDCGTTTTTAPELTTTTVVASTTTTSPPRVVNTPPEGPARTQHTVPNRLPATGAGDAVLWTIVGLLVLTTGVILFTQRRRSS